MTSPDTAVSASAVRAAHEVRTVIGRLRRRLKETYDTEGLTPSQTSSTGQAFREDKRRASVEWLARSLQQRYTERERQAMLEALALLNRLVES